jgi:hypothetical protein
MTGAFSRLRHRSSPHAVGRFSDLGERRVGHGVGRSVRALPLGTPGTADRATRVRTREVFVSRFCFFLFLLSPRSEECDWVTERQRQSGRQRHHETHRSHRECVALCGVWRRWTVDSGVALRYSGRSGLVALSGRASLDDELELSLRVRSRALRVPVHARWGALTAHRSRGTGGVWGAEGDRVQFQVPHRCQYASCQGGRHASKFPFDVSVSVSIFDWGSSI